MHCRLPTLLLFLSLTAFSLSLFSKPAFCREEIVLGVATSLETLEGRESHMSVRLAAEEINRAGGIRVGDRTFPIRVAAVDLEDAYPSTPMDEILQKLGRFLIEQRVDAIVVGFFRSEALLAGMDLIARKGIPLLGTIAMSPASEAKILQSAKYRPVFRLGLNSRYLVDYLIQTMKFLRERFGVGRVYILNQDVAWTRTTVSLMIKLYFEQAGWEVLGMDIYPTGASDFTQSLVEARRLNADVILPIFDMAESGALVRQWNRMESGALLCGFISPMGGPGAWEAFQGGIEGALNVIFELGNVPSDAYVPAKAFYEAFERRYGTEIEAAHGPAPAYESVYILAEAMERAGSLEPEAVIRALEETDRQGVMGRIRFHRSHQVIFGEDPFEEALACVIQWTDQGERRVVYPSSIAEGKIMLPGTRSSP